MFKKNDHLNNVVSEADSLAGNVAIARNRNGIWNNSEKGQEEHALNTFIKNHPEVKGLTFFTMASISYNQCKAISPNNTEYYCLDSIKDYDRLKDACYMESTYRAGNT